MDIKQKYREELNKDPYCQTKTGAYVKSGSYSDDYVKWLEKQFAISGVGSAFYCKRDIEGESICDAQCDHCNEYYKPLEQ